MKMVLISGWACSVSSMQPLAALLAPEHACECFDLEMLSARGSAEPVDGLSGYAAGLCRILYDLPERCVLAGWSTGAMVLLEAAAHLPSDKVAGAVFMSGTAKFSGESEAGCRRVQPEALKEMRRDLARIPEAVSGGFFRQVDFPQSVSDVDLQERTEAALAKGLPALDAGLAYLAEADLRDAARGLKLPGLVLHGKRDRVIHVSLGRELAALSGAEFVAVAGGGHNLPACHAAETAETLRSFAERLRA